MMKNPKIILTYIILFIVLLGFIILFSVKKDVVGKTVFVIILDGFSSDYLNKTLYLKSLAEQGLANLTAVTIMPSITPAAHASMFTGVNPELHGIKDYERRPLKKPTIISHLKNKNIKTCVVAGKTSLDFLLMEADYGLNTTFLNVNKENEIDSKTLEMTLSLYEEEVCQLFIINLPATDIIGHKYGPLSEEINNYLSELDSVLNNFLPKFGESTVIIISDHGMCTNKLGKGYHGTNETCAMSVPIIVKSKIITNESLSSVKDVYKLIKKLYS